jgi:periplasmic divalent cation tolerance protein
MPGPATGEEAGLDEPLLCFCTCPSAEVAEALARDLVEARLAACVNLLPGVQSVYRWQGAVETAAEVMLWAKTTRRHFPAL